MEIELARFAGACYGVQRALDLAQNVAESGESAVTLGPIIHNPYVVNKLADQGIYSVDNVDDVDASVVIIRSHGITPQVRLALENRGLTLVDATCPHVSHAQNAAARMAQENATVVVVGESGHPEVESIVAYAHTGQAAVLVAMSAQDLPEHLDAPVGVVVQTTQKRETLDAVTNELRARGINPAVSNTICLATQQRQETAAQLAREVDAMIVIGGRNSSNTTRLHGICAKLCRAAYHVESAEEIDLSWFEGCARVGVTAGASTPMEQIQAVINLLEQAC